MMEYEVYISNDDAFEHVGTVKIDHVTKEEVDTLAEIALRNSLDMLVRPVKKGK